jgi:hypothetical protein
MLTEIINNITTEITPSNNLIPTTLSINILLSKKKSEKEIRKRNQQKKSVKRNQKKEISKKKPKKRYDKIIIYQTYRMSSGLGAFERDILWNLQNIDTSNVKLFYTRDSILYYDEESELPADDGIVIRIKNSERGRWIRQISTDYIPVEWFGVEKKNSALINTMRLKVALESPHTKGKRLIFGEGKYLIEPFAVKADNITIEGQGRRKTFLVGQGMRNSLIRFTSDSDNLTIKNLGIKPADFPSYFEDGWNKLFKRTAKGFKFANEVKTINSFAILPELDLSDQPTYEAFKDILIEKQNNITRTIVQVGILEATNKNSFMTFGGQIGIYPNQTDTIIQYIDAGIYFDENWTPVIRVVNERNVLHNNIVAEIVPAGYYSPSKVKEIDIVAEVNQVGNVFEIKFIFPKPGPADLSEVRTIDGKYIFHYALDMYRRVDNFRMENVFIDGLWYAGPYDVRNSASRIGYDNPLSFTAVKRAVISNCDIANYCNDGIGCKEIFDSWGPSIQTTPLNNYIHVEDCEIWRGGVSGIDIECNELFVTKSKMRTFNFGCARYGSRGYGAVQKIASFLDCDFVFDPLGIADRAISTNRFLGNSKLKNVVYSGCNFTVVNSANTIHILLKPKGIASTSRPPEDILIYKCSFNDTFTVYHTNGNIDKMVLSCDINQSSNGCIVYISHKCFVKNAFIEAFVNSPFVSYVLSGSKGAFESLDTKIFSNGKLVLNAPFEERLNTILPS